MCLGTTKEGERCRRPSRDGWCGSHKHQKSLPDSERCKAVRADDHRCTRKAVRNGFCEVPSHSPAEVVSYDQEEQCHGRFGDNQQCPKDATLGGYCDCHQYQREGRVCQGRKTNGEQCWAEAKANGYCRSLHDPARHFLDPQVLRVEFDKAKHEELWERDAGMDAYTGRAVNGKKNLDHVFEHQLATHALDLVWASKRDQFGSDESLTNVVEILRDGVANADFNLKYTSACNNLLKSDACTRLVEAQRQGDIVTTFTDHMDQAKSSHYRGKRLSRETSKAIRETMFKTVKEYKNKVNDENDNNSIMDALEKKLQSLRTTINS